MTRIKGKAIDGNALIEVDSEIETQTIQGTFSAKVTSISRNA